MTQNPNSALGVGAPTSPGRRVFLETTSAAALLAGLGWLAPNLAGPRPAAAEPAPGKLASRRLLAEPGPMLPPVPAVLLTVNGPGGDAPDEISVVWTFVLNGDPPQVGISAHHEHVARELVRKHGQFVLNVPTAELVDAFDIVDMSSSKVGDKFVLSGLTRGTASRVAAPTVAEAPIQVECRVFEVLEVPPVRTLFLAEVVATTVHQGVCDENGRLIVPAVRFFGMTAGSGEFYTMGERIGHIGKSVGRDDIKY